MPLFPPWTHISHPREIKGPWDAKLRTVYCIHLRAPCIPRFLGNDKGSILYIGYAISTKRRLFEFLSSSRNGTSTGRVGQTLYYYRHRSPGMSITSSPSVSWEATGRHSRSASGQNA
jgi:hypothetical protein